MRKISSVFQRGAAALVLGMAAGCATITPPAEDDNASDSYNSELDSALTVGFKVKALEHQRKTGLSSPAATTLILQKALHPIYNEKMTDLGSICAVARVVQEMGIETARAATIEHDFISAHTARETATNAGRIHFIFGCAAKPEPGDQTENDDDGFVVPIARANKADLMVG